MKYLYFFLIIGISINFSCKKEEESFMHFPGCDDTTNLSSNLSGFKYLPGSYWVMVDSVNGNTDSVYVSTSEGGYILDHCGIFQYHSFKTISSLTMTMDTYKLQQSSITKNEVLTIYPGSYYYDSLYISNQYYQNVTKRVVTADPTQGYNKATYYLSPDVGFIRIEIVDDTTGALLSKMILQNYNIVR
jgi:hypothetical protein